MSFEIFPEGGPLNAKKTGPDQYEMSIPLPKDADGRTARECPNTGCSPGYFKVTGGTGLKEQTIAYCPYCHKAAESSDFHSTKQVEYAKETVKRFALDGMQRAVHRAFGGSCTGNLRSRLPVSPPDEEILRRDLVCPHCTLNHSVYGFATWCPDCGKDIFTTHVRGEIAAVESILSDVDRRRELLGPRVAAADLENALEDLVSVWEATLKIEIRRYRRLNGDDDAAIEKIMGGIGSRLQSVPEAATRIPQHCDGAVLFGTAGDEAKLNRVFQKRHPITHNLGVVDRKYIDRVRSGEAEGTEVRVEKAEIEQTAQLAYAVLADLHNRLFPPVSA